MAAIPMVTPNDPKAPKFSGDDRTLVQFLDDYSRMADAALLSHYQKCYKLAGYLSAEVRDDVEQYDEYNGLVEATADADSWKNLRERFLKDYPNAKTVREIKRDDYLNFLAQCENREIKTEKELDAFMREFRRFSTKLIKTNMVSKPDAATAFYKVMLRNLGPDLTIALKFKKPDDDFTVDEIIESARKIMKKRATNTRVGLIFDPIVMSVQTTTTVPAPLAAVVKKEEQPDVLKTLLARIETLEKERDAFKKRAAGAGTTASTFKPRDMTCFYCPGEHNMEQCPLLEEDLKRGRCKRGEDNKIVFPDGGKIYPRAGKKIGERVAEWHKARQEQGTSGTASATIVETMLIEIGEEYMQELAPEPQVPTFATKEAEEAWWALMMDHAMVYQQRRAGLRSGDKSDGAAAKPAPPHEGKTPVSKATDPRGPTPADKTEAVKQGIQRFDPGAAKDVRPLQEGTPRTVPPSETIQPARPQFRVQAPVEREGAIQRIGKKIMDSEIVVTLEDLATIAPEIQRYVRMKVTPKRVAVNEAEIAGGTAALVEVLKFQIARPEEGDWNPDLVTAKPALPLRYLDCIIGKFQVEGVLDTGAQMVIISKRLWVELGRPIHANFPRITMQSANASKDRTIGLCANLEVKIYDIPFYLQAHVVEEAPFDLLLGRPFFALAHSDETSLPDGGTVITLRDPNSEVVLKVPTKARTRPQPRREEEHAEAHIVEIEEPHF